MLVECEQFVPGTQLESGNYAWIPTQACVGQYCPALCPVICANMAAIG